MEKSVDKNRKSLPRWLTITLQITLWALFVVGLLAVALGWLTGQVSNLYFLLLLCGPIVLLLSRGVRAFTGGIAWRDLRGERGVSPFVHMGARVVFWAALIWLALLSVPSVIFTAEEWAEMKIIIWICGLVAIGLSLLPKASRRRPMTVFSLLSLMLFCSVFFRLMSYENPKEAVVIGSPFAGESYVFQGGPTAMLSHHFPHKNQTHALDIIVLDVNGTMPEVDDITDDPCFGVPLLAPIAGRVAVAVDGIADRPSKKMPSDNIVGNQVVIEAEGGDYFVLLAHLRKGSLRVAEGDRVDRGQVIGACGNSGNSTGPHLHIQAQNTARFEDPEIKTFPIAFERINRLRGTKAHSGRPLTLRRGDKIQPQTESQ